jgi:hypothetical protein
VADIFREVDEEVRREQLKKLWERYGPFVIAAAVLVFAAIAAWRGYEWWQTKKAAESGAAFESAANLADTGKHSEAEAAFTKLASDGTSGYRPLARMRAAAELAVTDPKAAIDAYESIAGDHAMRPEFAELAALRAGAILIDAGAFDQARSLLEPLTENDHTFRHTARELLVVAAWRAGDMALGQRWVDMIMTDLQTPPGTRARVEMLTALNATKS